MHKLWATIGFFCALAFAGCVGTPTDLDVKVSTEGIEKPTPERKFELTLDTKLSLSLARNETTGRVLALSLSGCQPLLTDGVPAGVTVTLFHMPWVQTSTPSFAGAITGAHYDPLVPLSTTNNSVCSDEAYVWADIGVDATVAPGTYSFSIHNLPVQLTVWKLTLPQRPTMPMYVGLSSFALLAAHQLSSTSSVSVQGPLTSAYVAAMRAHRLEPDGQFIADAKTNPDGTLNLDLYGSQGGSFNELIVEGAQAPICVSSPSTTTSPWLSSTQLAGWELAIKANAALANAWAYLTDEPNDLVGTATRAGLVRTYAPDLKTMVTHEPTTSLLGLIDHFVTVFEDFKQPGHWTDYSQAPGYWLYGSCESHGSCLAGTLGKRTGTPDLMIDEPDVNGRAFPLVAYQLGAQAALYYSSVQAYGRLDPWQSQFLFAGNGDGTLFYPGVKGTMGFTDNEPVTSIRMKALREGQNDIEYLAAARAAGLSTDFGTLVPDQFNWSHNNGDYDALHDSIGAQLGN